MAWHGSHQPIFFIFPHLRQRGRPSGVRFATYFFSPQLEQALCCATLCLRRRSLQVEQSGLPAINGFLSGRRAWTFLLFPHLQHFSRFSGNDSEHFEQIGLP
jgi:hypothetical protein